MSSGLSLPLEIIADAPISGSILVADGSKNQIVCLWDGNSGTNNNSVVARSWTGGNSLVQPYDMFFDGTGGNNLYVSDTGNDRVVIFTGMQSVAPLPKVIAGTGTTGAGANQLNAPRGVVIDGQGNTIIADYGNHRVMRYAPNATSGTMIIGSGTAGSDSRSLNNPMSLFLDELNSWLYVADVSNHRIQRFSLNSSFPLNGTTVAGGYGPGSGSHQLDKPFGIWVSTKTGAVYIADSNNNRVQRWSQGATTGVTIAGDPNGTFGGNAIMLRTPSRLSGNTNETMLYVSDANNHRIQRFQLI